MWCRLRGELTCLCAAGNLPFVFCCSLYFLEHGKCGIWVGDGTEGDDGAFGAILLELCPLVRSGYFPFTIVIIVSGFDDILVAMPGQSFVFPRRGPCPYRRELSSIPWYGHCAVLVSGIVVECDLMWNTWKLFSFNITTTCWLVASFQKGDRFSPLWKGAIISNCFPDWARKLYYSAPWNSKTILPLKIDHTVIMTQISNMPKMPYVHNYKHMGGFICSRYCFQSLFYLSILLGQTERSP